MPQAYTALLADLNQLEQGNYCIAAEHCHWEVTEIEIMIQVRVLDNGDYHDVMGWRMYLSPSLGHGRIMAQAEKLLTACAAGRPYPF